MKLENNIFIVYFRGIYNFLLVLLSEHTVNVHDFQDGHLPLLLFPKEVCELLMLHVLLHKRTKMLETV